MPAILGIGGFFFKARNPKELATWYAEHFEISEVPGDYDQPAWRQRGGTTIFAPFEAESGLFGSGDKHWMINFRVRDLDETVAYLRDANIAVEVDPDTYPNGRFASLADPEGNPIQLWEPTGAALDAEESG